MAYQTYTTEALVCGTFNRNTADRSYLLFTRDDGMLFATARSAREERSRQRYALQDFSFIRVSLVRGKGDWRIGSIEAIANFYQEAVDRSARGSVISLVRLLRRFVHGEINDPGLFDASLLLLNKLSGDVEDRSFLQLVGEVRLLAQLGHVDEKKIPNSVRDLDLNKLTAVCDDSERALLKDIYAQALTTSHL